MAERARILEKVLILVLAFGGPAAAAARTVVLHNTGVDGADRLVPLLGAETAHWRLVSQPAGSTLPPRSRPFRYFNVAYIFDTPDAAWVSPGVDGNAGVGGDYVYELPIDLTGIDLSRVVITGGFATDNEGAIWLNDGAPVADTVGTQFSVLKTFSISSGFVPGLNFIRVRVSNSGDPTAFIVRFDKAVWSRDGTGLEKLGASVGTAGDVNCDGISDLILGAPFAGTAPTGQFIFARAGWAGVWFGSANVPPQPSAAPDWFATGAIPFTDTTDIRMGSSVAAGDVNGDGCDDVIVGAPSVGPQAPRVQVFFGRASEGAGDPGGPFGADWNVVSGDGCDFGESVAAGDVNRDGLADVIVGAPCRDLAPLAGSVRVFLGRQSSAGPTSSAEANWTVTSTSPSLGASVASAGDVDRDGDDDILAGAPDGAGAAFLWAGDPSLVLASNVVTTTSAARWTLAIGGADTNFGASVAGVGDFDGDGFADFIVGGPGFESQFGTDAGIAVVVRGSAFGPATGTSSWSHLGAFPTGRFGTSVASAGDFDGDGRGDYLIGEPNIPLIGTDGQMPRVHLVLGRPSPSFAGPVAADAQFTSRETTFGRAVGTAGDWDGDGFSDVVVGAPGPNPLGDNGKAFVYAGRGRTLASAPVFASPSALQAGENQGLGLAFAGDVDHDGLGDYVTGAPAYESGAGQDGEGIVRIFYGGGLFEFGGREGDQDGAQLGWSLDGAGDVNGDGFDDVIAGAPGFDGFIPFCVPIEQCRVSNIGQARIYHGSANGLSFSPSTFLTGAGIAGEQFGYSVAGAGDVNGDGFGDVIVGAPTASTGPAGEGRAFLFLGSPGGVNPTPVWSGSGGQFNARFGSPVAAAGDVDGDGYGDVIVGAEGFGATGAALVFRGRRGGLHPTPLHALTGLPVTAGSYGRAVSSAGDVNRDGFADVVIAAPAGFDPAALVFNAGYVELYHGGPGGLTFHSRLRQPTRVPQGQLFGSGVSGAGDVNGDGYGDLIVGAQWFTGPAGFAQGQAYLYHGGPSGIVDEAIRTFQDCPTAPCDFGRDVAGGGDLDGDGFADVLIGAYRYASDGGTVFVHRGGAGGGMPVTPLQSLGFGGAPRALLGITPDRMDGSLRMHSPAGRTRVGLELEFEALGQDFDGLGTLRRPGLLEDNVLFGRDALTFLGTPGGVYQWRARLRSLSPLFGRSRWVSLVGNAPRESDFRVLSDPDGDGINQAADLCPFYASPVQADTDQDARGDACECGDQNGDGRNTVGDLVAINQAIFNPALVTPLCDANNDGACNVSDIVAVNVEIFSPTNTSTCARQPVPGP